MIQMSKDLEVSLNTLINWKKYLGFIEGNSIQFKGRNFFCLTTSERYYNRKRKRSALGLYEFCRVLKEKSCLSLALF
ncbi:hypothetical protein LEP1GSC071_3067 [Leptospira santarosai str. JET]|nr:hypothetical protein LEP1GSC071_3067 [Leptospira santarosai str. JET]